MRVLLVEDEPRLRSYLEEQLRGQGCAVDAASDGEEGLYFGREHPFDVAIVDLGLPKLPGIELIRTLRSEGHKFPILILTAQGRWQEKVSGLEAGADDYLVKPFHFEELMARLNALVRRAAGWSQGTLKIGRIELDSVKQTVRIEDRPVSLTAFEYKALEYLMLHADRVISKTELTEHLYDQDFDRDSNVIEVFIGRLRRKIDPEGRLQPIETLRGRGYRFPMNPGGS